MSDKYIPPAFPCVKDRYGDPNEGMSLRDYFAAQALIGKYANGISSTPETTAKDCYRMADAMMAEREKS